jgi:hypothetical protein
MTNWKRFYGQMKLKSTGLDQMGGCILKKRRENHFLTEPPLLQSSMDVNQYCDIFDAGVVKSFEKLETPEGE